MSNWTTVSSIQDLPSGPGVYAIYSGDALMYVGSAVNIFNRFYLHGHMVGKISALLYGDTHKLRLKFRRVVKYGDWAMVELRLICRLAPPLNHQGIRRAKDKRRAYRRSPASASGREI